MLLSSDPNDARFGIGYAVAAYVVIFVVFFGYLGYLHVQQRRVRARLDDCAEQLRRTRKD